MPVPQDRIRSKVDELMGRLDYDGVERTLRYWLAEARQEEDRRGELMVLGELIGHCRKTGDRSQALQAAERAQELLEQLHMKDTLSAAATWINIATALSAFGDHEQALRLFRQARCVCEDAAAADDTLLGGLYNNMGLTLTALGKTDEAMEVFRLAMGRMRKVPHGALEQAVTCLNMADALSASPNSGEAEARINGLLEQAESLLNNPALPRDGYYAYVCQRCAPVFDHYGYFLTARELSRRAEEIYARS